MQRITIIPLVILILSGILPVAYASYQTSIVYSDLQQTRFPYWNYIDVFDKRYNACIITITPHEMTFNASVEDIYDFSIILNSENSTTSGKALRVSFHKSGTLDIIYQTGGEEGSYITIGSGTWANDTSVEIILYRGLINVKSNNTIVVEDFAFDEPLYALFTYSSTETTLTGGYVNVSVRPYGAIDVTPVINAYIPVIVCLALLAASLSFLKKLGKW